MSAEHTGFLWCLTMPKTNTCSAQSINIELNSHWFRFWLCQLQSLPYGTGLGKESGLTMIWTLFCFLDHTMPLHFPPIFCHLKLGVLFSDRWIVGEQSVWNFSGCNYLWNVSMNYISQIESLVQIVNFTFPSPSYKHFHLALSSSRSFIM